MKDNSEKNYGNKKVKKSAGEIVSKVLTVICALSAVVFIGVTAFALISSGNTKAPDTGDAAPEIITTTAPTTESTTVPTTVSTTAASATDSQTESTVASTSESETAQTGTSERKVVKLNQKHWSVIIVDKNREIPEGYEPELEFVADSDYALDARIAKYYNEMYDAAYEDGVVLTPYSGYRSYSTQESNYNSLVDSYVSQGFSQKEAEDKAATEILPPGCSEHNLGFAMDICSIEDSFKDTAEYKWLCENAHIYGFIERYPEGKQDITGVIPEPWHWRFIGPAYTEDMRERGAATLEEYLQSYGVNY